MKITFGLSAAMAATAGRRRTTRRRSIIILKGERGVTRSQRNSREPAFSSFGPPNS
jgi:hypothetical protein